MNHIFLSIHHVHKNYTLFPSIYLSMHFRRTFSTLLFYFLFIPFQLCNLIKSFGLSSFYCLFCCLFRLSLGFHCTTLYMQARAPPKLTTFFHTLKTIQYIVIIILHSHIEFGHILMPCQTTSPSIFPFSLHKRTNEFQTCHLLSLKVFVGYFMTLTRRRQESVHDR